MKVLRKNTGKNTHELRSYLTDLSQRIKCVVKLSIVFIHRIDSGILFHIEGPEYEMLSLNCSILGLGIV